VNKVEQMKTALSLIDELIAKLRVEFITNVEIIKDLDRIRQAVVLRSNVPKGKCRIYSTADNFREFTVDEQDMVKLCKDIWNNPHQYSIHPAGSPSSFTAFFKFIKIECWTGKKYTLSEIVREAR